ncbi:hypothetical protein [Nocardia cyriacigeorgica]|nr:hypothetical protein [Nocardia cyriacigeorgica]
MQADVRELLAAHGWQVARTHSSMHSGQSAGAIEHSIEELS